MSLWTTKCAARSQQELRLRAPRGQSTLNSSPPSKLLQDAIRKIIPNIKYRFIVTLSTWGYEVELTGKVTGKLGEYQSDLTFSLTFTSVLLRENKETFIDNEIFIFLLHKIDHFLLF